MPSPASLPAVRDARVEALASRPWLGFGLGLRTEYFDAVLAGVPAIDWLEVNTENFMVAGGKPRSYLAALREKYPIVFHGVSMSIGSTDPLDWRYLKALKELALAIEPAWISDHLCWTGVDGINSHDLLPLPYTESALAVVTRNVDHIQTLLGRRIAIVELVRGHDFPSHSDAGKRLWHIKPVPAAQPPGHSFGWQVPAARDAGTRCARCALWH